MVYGKWEPDPLVTILGEPTPLSSTNKYETQAILFGTVIAKELVLQAWRLDITPTYDLQLREITNMLHLERLSLYNEDGGDIFKKTWDPVPQLFQRKD